MFEPSNNFSFESSNKDIKKNANITLVLAGLLKGPTNQRQLLLLVGEVGAWQACHCRWPSHAST